MTHPFTPRPRGMCSHCGQPQAVLKSGAIYKHFDFGRGDVCVGSGKPAVRGTVDKKDQK